MRHYRNYVTSCFIRFGVVVNAFPDRLISLVQHLLRVYYERTCSIKEKKKLFPVRYEC